METGISRRHILGAGVLAGVGVVLSGCASKAQKTATLPGPRWPTATVPTEPRATPDWKSRAQTPTHPSSSSPGDEPIPGGVLSRSMWAQGAPIPSRMDPMLPVRRITVHHDGMPPVSVRAQADVAARIEQIRMSHIERGWGDIGYHYIVDPAGRVWQGRPLTWQGAHVKDQNPGNLGVLCLGNFEMQTPTPAQLAMLDRFVSSQMHRYGVSLASVKTHREMAPTICPGRNLQRYMDQTRSGGALASA